MEVRSANKKDIDKLLKLYRRTLRSIGHPYTSEQIKSIIDEVHPPTFVHDLNASIDEGLCEIVVEQEVIGFSSLISMGKKSVGLQYLIIDSGYQGKGIGSNLLQRSEDKAKNEGASSIGLRAFLNSVPFYESRGYRTEKLIWFDWWQFADRPLKFIDFKKEI